MSFQILTQKQSNSNHQTSVSELPRRRFLAIFAGTAAALPLANLPAHISQIAESAEVEYAPAERPPFGPPSRTILIDQWATRIDTTIIALERFWSFLREARTLPPEQVDGQQFYALDLAADDAMGRLGEAMDSAAFDDLYRATTGHSSFFWAISRDIKQDKGSRTSLQAYIDDFGKDHPADAAELQAMLDSRIAQSEVL